jgi:aspartate 1-decarboxylase
VLIKQLKCKLHRVRLTKVDLHYEGSLSIDRSLLVAAQLQPFEAIHVWNVSTGHRLETYAIEAPDGSGEIGLNGAAARGAALGDLLIVAAWIWRDALEPFAPLIVLVPPEQGSAANFVEFTNTSIEFRNVHPPRI